MNKNRNGWAVIIIALLYNFQESKYFGFQWHASCEAEVIADGISLILVAIGMLIFSLPSKTNP